MGEWKIVEQDPDVTVTHPTPPPSTPFSPLIPTQRIALISSLRLSSSQTLHQVPLAYRTWGVLSPPSEPSNVMVICHALTGSADVEDWWGPLIGPGKAFDPTRWFIVCCNVLGSPYGTASPVTVNPETGKRWGPEFPGTTMRDDVALQKVLLDFLGVRSVAVVIGGSMGGMLTLEYPLCTPPGYVQNIIPIATSARHSAWGISWGEAQRQSIYSDPKYSRGWYSIEDPPQAGLAAARMAALLTYRSRDSFESRFGRREQPVVGGRMEASPAERARAAHNDGHRTGGVPVDPTTGTIFTAQSYLRYQGTKFVSRFDANCYIHLTRKMDSHDVDREGRRGVGAEGCAGGGLVVGVSSDGLFMEGEQRELAEGIRGAELVVVVSPDGHDGFLLEFEQINTHVLSHLHKRLPYIDNRTPLLGVDETVEREEGVKKESLFGEEEGDGVTAW